LGLSSSDLKRLIPYIIMKNSNTHLTSNKKINSATRPFSKTVNSLHSIDINPADTNAFISLPGIGNRLARRIKKFRDKPGGFYSIDQVGETYLLPDLTFRKGKKCLG
jgi:competence protein ComEA